MLRKCYLFLFITLLGLPLTGCGPSQAEIEKIVKQGMEEQLKIQVKSLTLTKATGDDYMGKAETTTGAKYDITITVRGKEVSWQAKPSIQLPGQK